MNLLDIVRGALTGAAATALLLAGLRIAEVWQPPAPAWTFMAAAGLFFLMSTLIPASKDSAPSATPASARGDTAVGERTDDQAGRETQGEQGTAMPREELAASLVEATEALSSRGRSNLSVLLSEMNPVLLDPEFVFVTVPEDPNDWSDVLTETEPLGTFREAEGDSWLLARPVADAAELEYEAVFRGITLTVHSSLTAIGFLAVLTYALSEQGIAVNVVSAAYHDHLFVPKEHAQTALAVLQGLQRSAAAPEPRSDVSPQEGAEDVSPQEGAEDDG